MKKPDLGQTLGILANVGVVFGILLLAYELNQNRQMMESQTRAVLNEGFNEWLYNISADEQTSNLVTRGNRGEELTDYERNRYMWLILAQLRYYENVHYQFRNGLYDEDEFSAQREAWRTRVFVSKGVRDQFCGDRRILSPDFVAEIDSLITDYPCDQ